MYVDTSATFTAKDDFALLKALCFAEGKTPIESQRSRNLYGSVHPEVFISENDGSNYGTPGGHLPGGLELCA
jgi:hypothetical protein